MSSTSKCGYCGNPGNNACSKCLNIFYCTKEHQTLHWTSGHKDVCRPFKICDPDSERYAEVTRAIEPGEVLLTDKALVMGPTGKVVAGTVAVCVACNNVFNMVAQHPCDRCGWPLCSIRCRRNPNHIPECTSIYQNRKKVTNEEFLEYQSMNIALILRCLYTKGFRQCSTWKKFMAMPTPYDKNKDNAIAKSHFNRAKDIFKIFKLRREYKLEEVQKILGVIALYGFEQSIEDQSWRGVFENGHIFEHSCKANCYRVCTTEGVAKIIAARKILRGERLTVAYVDSFLMTHTRQERIRSFLICDTALCKCERCSDRTEYETYFSVFNCQKTECDGLVMPDSFVQENPRWECNKCKKRMNPEAVTKYYEHLEVAYLNAQRGACMKDFLTMQEKVLPPSQFYLMRAKVAIVRNMKELSNLTDQQLQFKITTCRQLLELLDKLMPADKAKRILILYEIQGALDELFVRKKCRERSPPQVLREILEERQEYLKEILAIRQYEPDKMHEQSERNLRRVEGMLEKLVI